MKPRLGALLTHPIQYYSPWLREVAKAADLTVYYAHQQTAEGQAKAGFGRGFEWDVPLLDGYEWRWLKNVSPHPGLTSFGGCDTPAIVGIVSEARFDAFMMFGWNRKSFIQAGWGAMKARTPVLVRLDSNLMAPRSPLKAAVKRVAYSAILPRAADYLSPGMRTDDYLRHYAVPQNRIHRVPHMVDVDRFGTGAAQARKSGRSEALRRAHGAGRGDFVFLFVGKLIPKKRPDLLVQAFRRLRALSPEAVAGARLWFVGDGPMLDELQAATQDVPASFLGFANQSELPALYAAADCLVLPSNGEETWGLVVNEAFACDLPAIVSAEAGCAPDLIRDGQTGWTMQAPEADHLASLLLVALSQARDLPRSAIREASAAACYSTGTERLLEVVSRVGASR